MPTVPERTSSCPSPGIRRASSSFDSIPADIQARTDLYPGAKRLYGLLRSVQNLNIEPSYADLAAALGASVRSIVRWTAQLVERGLILMWRRGQGLTNVATVVGMVVRSAMDAAARVPVRRQDTRMELHTKNERNNFRHKMQGSYAQGRLGAVPAR